MTLLQCSEIVRNLALALAAPFGAYVGWKGLNSWREEARWKKDSELAEDLLVLMHRRRDAVSNIRNPFVSYDPVKKDENDAEIVNQDYANFLGYIKVYQERVDQLQEVRSEIYGKRLRANAAWGGDLSGKLEEIFRLEQELIVQVRRNLDSRNPTKSEAQRQAAGKLVGRDILYDMGEEDEYTSDYNTIFEPIEEYLMQKARAPK